jgi:hypothetical protein
MNFKFEIQKIFLGAALSYTNAADAVALSNKFQDDWNQK